ncbi:MAG: MFS transporter, partial [Burkholderiales bacterium]
RSLSRQWRLGCFSGNSGQQARLVGLAPDLASASVALNTSCIYAGQAIGAGSGGVLITLGGLQLLPWAAAIGMALSLWISLQLRSSAAA